MTPEEEKKLVRRILRGDQEAFELLVAAHERRIYAMALHMSHNEQDALDLSQEVFLRIYRSLPEFRFHSSLTTWIYHICTNVCIDFLRSRRVRPLAESLSGDGSEELPDLDIPDDRWQPDAYALQQAALESLQNGLRRLSPKHRSILLMRGVEGLTYEEISRRLSIPTGTVKSRIARARELLRQILLEEGNFFPLEPSNILEAAEREGYYHV